MIFEDSIDLEVVLKDNKGYVICENEDGLKKPIISCDIEKQIQSLVDDN